MNKNIAKKVAGLTLGALLTAMPLKQVTAQTTNDSTPNEETFEYIKSNAEYHFQKGTSDKGRINMLYNLPLNTDVFSFIGLYDEDGYFLKNMAYTPIVKGLGSKIETKHCGAFSDKGGIGLEYRAMFPGGIFSSVKALPLWVDKNGVVDNDVILGYVLAKDFSVSDNVSLSLSSFGEINLASEDGITFCYGESELAAKIQTSIGQIDLGAGFNHYPKEGLMPDNQFRFRIGYHPKR